MPAHLPSHLAFSHPHLSSAPLIHTSHPHLSFAPLLRTSPSHLSFIPLLHITTCPPQVGPATEALEQAATLRPELREYVEREKAALHDK
jgi:hypothetical protein